MNRVPATKKVANKSEEHATYPECISFKKLFFFVMFASLKIKDFFFFSRRDVNPPFAHFNTLKFTFLHTLNQEVLDPSEMVRVLKNDLIISYVITSVCFMKREVISHSGGALALSVETRSFTQLSQWSFCQCR